MRQTSGAMICPKCSKLISVSEERCPFCGAWRPGMFGYAPALQKLFGRFEFPQLVLITCVVLYGIAILLDPSSIFGSGGLLGFLGPSTRALYQLGMTGGVASERGWWWTVLTAIYLHGGLLHIFFNMLSLRNLAPAIMNVYGNARGFVIFSIAGIVGNVVSNLAWHAPSIGASGSIFGLVAALIVYGRRRGHSTLTAQLIQSAVIMFAMGFFIPNVNNFAHAGGFAGGWITASAVGFDDERREGTTVRVLGLVLIVATLLGFVLSFVSVTSLLMRS